MFLTFETDSFEVKTNVSYKVQKYNAKKKYFDSFLSLVAWNLVRKENEYHKRYIDNIFVNITTYIAKLFTFQQKSIFFKKTIQTTLSK